MTKLTEKEVAEVIDLRRNGASLTSIAKKYSITGERVRQVVMKYNETASDPVDLRTNGTGRSVDPKVTERRQKVVELRKEGKKLREIAEMLNIPQYIVVQDVRIMHKNGNL